MKTAFRDLLRPEVFLHISDTPNYILLKEDAPDSTIKKLRIYNPPQDCAAFQLDPAQSKGLKSLGKALKQLSWIVNASHVNANKKCDMVVVWKNDANINVLLMDLKSEGSKQSDCKRQLRNSQIFTDLLICLAKEYHGVSGEINYFKAIIKGTRTFTSKSPTNQNNRQKPTMIDNIIYIDSPSSGRQNSEAAINFADMCASAH